MDSLTQIVLGAAVGEAVLGKKIGNQAIVWGAVAGTIPDLDVLTKFFVDDVTANEWHRGFSHSILFCVMAAPVFGWLLHKVYKKNNASWKDWTLLMFWGLFTHPLLDSFTTWGTQLFWPLPYKLSFKNIFVVDPLYTLPFLGLVIATMFYKRNNPKRQKLNRLGLMISSCYLLITLALKWYTFTVFKQSLASQQISYTEIQTRPAPLTSFLWTANVACDDTYLIGYYSIFDNTKQVEFTSIPKNHSALTAIKDESIVQRLIQLTRGWYAIRKDHNKWIFNDLRFGQMGFSSTSDFVFSYILYYDENGKLIAKEKERTERDASKLLPALLSRIAGD
ncbi:metal-dependent hydrolase [Aquimarina brevivitae]|uniref:Inner membrane protein n=1 Tax=Aquimarina brevivitae TaxID=323412 RepID=A0A4Q7P1C6_9FLAO|nr:metal-dependent hydrolase [Aquimarina brevivitae]RZS92442.1 inner membrane protein [Aquimarina brevivitae]